MKIVGIDPGIKQHHATLYQPKLPKDGDCDAQPCGYVSGVLHLRHDRAARDGSPSSTRSLAIEDPCPVQIVTAPNLVVVEWPEWQGSARAFPRHKNSPPDTPPEGWFLATHKRAAMLLERLRDYSPGAVYCAPTRVIRGRLLGKATASDAELLAWLRTKNVPTGKGTPFTHEMIHNADSLAAALWGWIEWQQHGLNSEHYQPLNAAS